MKIVVTIVVMIFALFAAMLVIGHATATPEGDAIFRAKDAVVARMRDGNSAEFRAIKVYHPAGENIVVCGEVNGDNAFGGKAGFSRFYYSNGVAILEQAPGDDVFDGLWSSDGCDGSKGPPRVTQP